MQNIFILIFSCLAFGSQASYEAGWKLTQQSVERLEKAGNTCITQTISAELGELRTRFSGALATGSVLKQDYAFIQHLLAYCRLDTFLSSHAATKPDHGFVLHATGDVFGKYSGLEGAASTK